MKNSTKILSLCMAMIFVFVGNSMAKTKLNLEDKKTVSSSSNKNPCFSKIGTRMDEIGDFEFGGKCDSAKESATSAQVNSRAVCDRLGGSDPLCTSARDSEDKAQSAYTDCLTNQQTKTDAVVKVINAGAGVIKALGDGLIKITINRTTTKTIPSTPIGTPIGGLSPDTPATPIEPISPFDITD